MIHTATPSIHQHDHGMNQGPQGQLQQQQQQQQQPQTEEDKDSNIFIPDIIEEKRKTAEGEYVVVNEYACGKLLGKGGFAKCYIGTNLATNFNYALKIVPKCNIVKPRAKAKLQTEIKIHRVLNHANICKFSRCFEDVHNAYILLELCSNNSMSELMKKRKRLVEPEVRYYLVQLIDSLQYLKENLVIHRDLKLGNLFIDDRMRIKVGDFGLAAILQEPGERRMTVCGTPNYIAPEILQKKGHSFEVDIWSTGVVLYTLLVGKPPFETKEVKTTYDKILECSYTFPDTVSVSSTAKDMINRMLQLSPGDRDSWEDLLLHPFFRHPSAFMPSSLPESAIREVPSFALQKIGESSKVFDNASKFNIQTRSHEEENDPSIINRGVPMVYNNNNNNNWTDFNGTKYNRGDVNYGDNNNDNNNFSQSPRLNNMMTSSSSGSQSVNHLDRKVSSGLQSMQSLQLTSDINNSNRNQQGEFVVFDSSSQSTSANNQLSMSNQSATTYFSANGMSTSSRSDSGQNNSLQRPLSGQMSNRSSTRTVNNGYQQEGFAAENFQHNRQMQQQQQQQQQQLSAPAFGSNSTFRKPLKPLISSNASQQPVQGSNSLAAISLNKQSSFESGQVEAMRSSYEGGARGGMESNINVGNVYKTDQHSNNVNNFDFSNNYYNGSEVDRSTTTGNMQANNKFSATSLVDRYESHSTSEGANSALSRMKLTSQRDNRVDEIQIDIENIHVNDNNSSSHNDKYDQNCATRSHSAPAIRSLKQRQSFGSTSQQGGVSGPLNFDKFGSNNGAHIGIETSAPPLNKVEAWSWNGNHGSTAHPGAGTNPMSTHLPSNHVTTTTTTTSTTITGLFDRSSKGGVQSVAAALATTTTTLTTVNSNNFTPAPTPRDNTDAEPVGTLEQMHRMLDQSYMNENGERSPSNTIDYLSKNLTSHPAGSRSEQQHHSNRYHVGMSERPPMTKVWAVRYVDYTSKYGLGYLLNTGAAGVYFNDSTKIILSPDGQLFQYIERRKQDSGQFPEVCSQFHALSAYPVELQKKVLLLKHFKNYLLEQHKSCNDANADYSQPVQSLPMMQDNGVGSGANPNIPFGLSSIFNAVGSDQINIEDSSDMVYVKKWVRTRHAILFRLSNKTVHVVFFDRSEVMLSSEDRAIIYVNKQGVRQEYVLEDVMVNGPLEVNKRLRYTKDIMYKLINPNAN